MRYIKDILAYDQYAQYDISNDVSLTDSDIQKIANLWVPYYKSGNRHDISVGTIGLYAKNGLTANTAKKLSLELSRITKDDQTRLIDLTATYSRLSQNKSIKSVALLEPIIGDNLGPILSEFHNILRCYKRVEQDFDEKLIHNGSNIRSQSNVRRHDIPFIPDPTFNRAVAKPDISNIKIQSTDSNSFIQLIIGFIHEQRDEIRLEPKILLKELKSFIISKSLDYHKTLPQDPSWLVRRLRSYRDILKEAGLILDMHRSNGRRYIILKKPLADMI